MRAFRTAPFTPFDACCFGRCRCSAIRCGSVMLGHFHDDVARPLLITEPAAHRRGTQSLPSRPFIHEAARDEQRVHVERFARIIGFALRVGDGAAQSLLDFLRHALFREAQRLQSFFRALAAN